MTYNGWTNYETWLTNLYFDGYGGIFQELASEGVFDDMDEYEIQGYIAEHLETMITDYVDSTVGENSLFITDIINAFLGEIDYGEMASHYVGDIVDYLREMEEAQV